MSKVIEEKAKDYAVSQVQACTDVKMCQQAMLSLCMFKGYDVAAGYKDGYERALQDIERQIDLAAVNGYKFPLLHIRHCIDVLLGRKKGELLK